MLLVEGLKKTYRDKGRVVEAVKGISFSAKECEVFALLGPNGAGKSTTIKSILGLVIPDEGRVEISGIDVLKHRKKALRMMSAVLEGNRNVHWRMTVIENMKYFGAIRGLSGRFLKSRIRDLIDRFGLSEHVKKLAGQLSRGYQQKLAVAISLLPDAPVLLLDEPTLGLDVESSREMRKIIRDIASEGKLVLLSSHDMNLVEAVSDRVMIINKGKVVAMDKTENLKEMFRRRAYKIVLEKKPTPSLLEKLKSFAKISENGEKVTLDVEFESSSSIYDLFEILKEERVPIKSIESEDIDFEEVFIKIVRGDRS